MAAHLLLLIVYCLLCIALGYLGKDRKFGFVGNFFVSFFMSPVIGLLVLVAQNPKAPAAQRK